MGSHPSKGKKRGKKKEQVSSPSKELDSTDRLLEPIETEHRDKAEKTAAVADIEKVKIDDSQPGDSEEQSASVHSKESDQEYTMPLFKKQSSEAKKRLQHQMYLVSHFNHHRFYSVYCECDFYNW